MTQQLMQQAKKAVRKIGQDLLVTLLGPNRVFQGTPELLKMFKTKKKRKVVKAKTE